MTLSEKIADDILKQKEITLQDLGFYLTVIRDNCLDDNTEQKINNLIKNINKLIP